MHERYRRQTDRQTDGRRHIANMNMSSRSLKMSGFQRRWLQRWRKWVPACRSRNCKCPWAVCDSSCNLCEMRLYEQEQDKNMVPPTQPAPQPPPSRLAATSGANVKRSSTLTTMSQTEKPSIPMHRASTFIPHSSLDDDGYFYTRVIACLLAYLLSSLRQFLWFGWLSE